MLPLATATPQAQLSGRLWRSAASSPALLAPIHQQHQQRRSCPRLARLQPVASAKRGPPKSELDLYVQAVPTTPVDVPPPKATTKVPFYVYGPLAFLGLIAVLRGIKAILRRGRRGSLGDEYRRDVADQQYYEKLMAGMKTMQYEELTEEQILAARRRRMQEVARDSAPLDLDKIEIPDNHPFAVKKQLTPEEERIQAQRLRAKRGLSEEDLKLLQEAQRQSMAEE